MNHPLLGQLRLRSMFGPNAPQKGVGPALKALSGDVPGGQRCLTGGKKPQFWHFWLNPCFSASSDGLCLDLAGINSDLMTPNPDLAGINPDLVGANLDLVGANLDLVAPNPDLVAVNLDLAAPNPDLVGVNLDLAAVNPDLAGVNLDLAAVNPDLAAINPGLMEMRNGASLRMRSRLILLLWRC